VSHLTIEDIKTAHKPKSESEPESESDQTDIEIKPASQLSIDYMRNLISERYPDATEEYIQSVIDQGQPRVSRAIDKLKTMPCASLPNLYPGKCAECGERVEVREGLRMEVSGKWRITHLEGECSVEVFGIPTGRYALRDDEGTVHFYWLREDGLFVQASDEFHRVATRKTQARIIKDIQVDPEGASVLYGRELGVCGRCGRTLTDEESRERGIGPVCAEKGWSS